MLKRLLILSMVIVSSMLLVASEVLACSCAAKPTVLDSFEESELVVATRLASIEKTREKEEEFEVGHIRSATMIVTKVFKGNVKPGQALKFAQGGGADCVWTFEEEWVGEEFLFYLSPPSKGHPWMKGPEDANAEPMYRAITCGRSNGWEGAIDDRAYLENLSKVRGKTRLSGRFGAWFDTFTGADIKLKIAGKTKTYTAKTDKDGFFEIYDLPPGEYLVTVDLPLGWKINNYMLERTSTGYEEFDPRAKAKTKNQIPVRIQSGRHVALDLTFDVDSAIKGVVLSPAGRPMKDVCVKAVSTELKEGDYRGRFDCTNEKGEFVIEEMGRGNYILVVNDDGRPSESNPFGVVFYPGVTDFKNAGVIAVEPGKYVTDRVIQIPQTVELVTIKGKLLYSDGNPVVDERVVFAPVDEKRFDTVRQQTDATGGFLFRLPKGAAGSIFGVMYVYSGEFKNCPKLEAIIKESGKTAHTVNSTEVAVSGMESAELVEITFRFPSCEKAKKN